MVACPGFLSPGRWRQVDIWNSLAGQPRLLVEFLVNGISCLKNKQHNTKQNKKQMEQTTQVFPLAPTCVCTHIHTHSTNSIC